MGFALKNPHLKDGEKYDSEIKEEKFIFRFWEYTLAAMLISTIGLIILFCKLFKSDKNEYVDYYDSECDETEYET